MQSLPTSSKVVLDFMGLADNQDPRDPEPGVAIDQVNVASIKLGELRVRNGYTRMIFEDDDG